MMPALSEPVALLPGTSVRVELVAQAATAPIPERFLHFHGPAELVLIEQGSGRFLSEAGAHVFGPGQMLYVPAMAIHDFAFDPGARRWILVQFDALAIDPERSGLPQTAAAAPLDAPQLARTRMLLDWLAETLTAQAPEADVLVLLETLLLSLKGRFDLAPGLGSAGTPHLARFRPLLQQLSRNPGKVLGLADAASLCGLSPAYFSRCFTQAFGTGFIAYQTQMRLQQAARILATSDTPVSQIGYRLGFSSPAYFAQCYKAMFGTSPTQHRRMARSRTRAA